MDNRLGLDIALERIAQTQAAGDMSLDLKSLKLTVLPPEIGALTALTWLGISDN